MAATLNLTPDELLTTTRAVRKRLDFDRPVPVELVRECIEVATQAPTGSNQQGWHWVIVTDPDKRKALGEMYQQAFDAYRNMPVLRGPHLHRRPDRVTRPRHRVASSAEYLAEHMGEAPVLRHPVHRRAHRRHARLDQRAASGDRCSPRCGASARRPRPRPRHVVDDLHLMFEKDAAERARHPVRHDQPGRADPRRLHEGHRLQARAPHRSRPDRPRRQLVMDSLDDVCDTPPRRPAASCRRTRASRSTTRPPALTVDGPMLEIGSYCGKSAVYLGAAAQRARHRAVLRRPPPRVRGEPARLGVARARPRRSRTSGRWTRCRIFRRTIHDAGLEGTVIAVVADSPTLAAYWTTPLALLFIDGGHGTEPAHRDYERWTPHVAPGGLLAIHDVFPDPADGGRPPYEIYCRALESKRFEDVSATGSLRVLRSVAVER